MFQVNMLKKNCDSPFEIKNAGPWRPKGFEKFPKKLSGREGKDTAQSVCDGYYWVTLGEDAGRRAPM